ncbi:MAG: ABC transporter substrate-binding protein [Sphaerochaetaceae bacterium]|nr:ABC transporter substrate-binding protein [Sphaerochaetaceae bacterium]
MKKVLTFALVLLLSFAVFAGGSSEKKDDGKFVVGICQLVQHPALDAATQGFKDALVAEFGDKVVIDEQNASGEINNCSTIINGFVSKNVDLIMANATPALTAAASATNTIPILGTSITHYGTALEIDNWTGVVGSNISGTSDLAPLDQQAAMILEWFPNVKSVGLVYCTAEPNSIFQIEEVEKTLAGLGVKTQRFSFTDSNDIAAVVQKACDSSDVLYIPTDNTAASNAELVTNITLAAKTPVFVGEIGNSAGIAALSISYYDLGVTTGKMAVKVLKGEVDIKTLPVEYTTAEKKFNPDMCAALGITPLAGYTSSK